MYDITQEEKISNLTKEEARKKLNMPSGFILFVGSLIQERNPLAIVELARRMPDKKFVIIGD